MSKGFNAVLMVFIMLPCLLFGSGFGSKSLLYVQTASTLKPQRLDLGTNMRFFTKVGDFLGGQKPANFAQVNYWDVQGNVGFSYGLIEHFDISALLRVYQDVHYEGANFVNNREYNFPDDLWLSLKAGSFGSGKMQFGAMAQTRLPLGDVHNYAFEQYSAGGVELIFRGLFSYYNDPFINERDFSLHANVGFHYYNDTGKEIYNDINSGPVLAQNNASSIEYGAAFTYPTELFDLNLELWGNAFTSEPDTFAFSRENWLYITPSISYKPKWRYSFDLGMDIRLSSDEDTSTPLASFDGRDLDLPNYPNWKMTLGLNVILNSGKDKFRGGFDSKGNVKEKVDFYERLLQEREKTRSIEEELRRLKREREQAEKELEELRQLLEEEGR